MGVAAALAFSLPLALPILAPMTQTQARADYRYTLEYYVVLWHPQWGVQYQGPYTITTFADYGTAAYWANYIDDIQWTQGLNGWWFKYQAYVV
jgi:hypothetical protein